MIHELTRLGIRKKSGFAMFFFTCIKVFSTYFNHLFFNYCSLFWNSFEQRLIIILLLLLRLPLIIISIGNHTVSSSIWN